MAFNSNPPGPPSNLRPGAGTTVDDLARVFNTAIVATQAPENRNKAAELHQLMESPAFRAILAATRQLARSEGMTERQAAEQVIRTFRKVDQIWSDYVYQEGVDRLRSQIAPS